MLGRRIAKQDAFGQALFIWKGMRLIEERLGARVVNYVYERGETVRIVGSAVPPAQQRHAREEALEQNLRLQGQYLDRETGLYYNRFRYDDPDVGRFVRRIRLV